jgi:hypothetical protein
MAEQEFDLQPEVDSEFDLQPEAGDPPKPAYKGPLSNIRATEAGKGLFSMGTLEDLLRAGTLPMAGAAVGAMTGPAAPIAIPALAAGGEALNQYLGLTPRSNAQLALSAIPIPGATAIKSLGRSTIGQMGKRFATGEAMGEAAETALKTLPLGKSGSRLLSETPSGNWYSEAKEAVKGLVFKDEKIGDKILDVAEKEFPQAETAFKKEILEQLNTFYDFFSKQKPGEAVLKEVNRLSALARRAFKGGNNDLGNSLNEIRDTAIQGLVDNGVPAARLAPMTFSREKALEKIASIAKKSEPVTKLAEEFSKNKLLASRFTGIEKDEIKNIMKRIQGTTRSGGAGLFGRASTAGAGGLLGGPLGMILGYEAPAVLGGVARKFPKTLAQYLAGAPVTTSMKTKIGAQTLEALLSPQDY